MIKICFARETWVQQIKRKTITDRQIQSLRVQYAWNVHLCLKAKSPPTCPPTCPLTVHAEWKACGQGLLRAASSCLPDLSVSFACFYSWRRSVSAWRRSWCENWKQRTWRSSSNTLCETDRLGHDNTGINLNVMEVCHVTLLLAPLWKQFDNLQEKREEAPHHTMKATNSVAL